MKTKLIALSVFLFICSNCFSQSSKFMITLDGGVNKFLNNPNGYKTGYVVGLKTGYKLNNKFITGLKLDYRSNSPSDKVNDPTTITYVKGGQAIDFGIKAFLMYGNFNTQKSQTLYFLVGAGVDMIKTASGETKETGKFDATSFNTNFGIDLGVGMAFKVSKSVSLYIQPEFTGSFSSSSSTRTSIALKGGVWFGL